MSKRLTAWSGVVPIKAKSCPSSTLYVGLSRLSSMASDCSRVNELLRWLVGWCRLLKVKQQAHNYKKNKFIHKSLKWFSKKKNLSKKQNKYLWGACVNSKSWLAIISKSEGADMLRRNTGCFTMGITVLASDTDLEANVNKIKNNLMRIKGLLKYQHS